MRFLIFIVSMILLLWVLCGVISYFIIRHIAMRVYGKKPSSSYFIRIVTGFIISGPLGLFVVICALKIIVKRMGRCIEGNCYNGQGTTVYANGEKYVGQWEDGKYNGMGTYIYPDGRLITGYWKDDNLISEEKSVTNDNRKQ